MPTCGVLLFAHNNKEIDYVKIAYANALMIKKNLNVGVTLVTDDGTMSWAKTSIGEDELNNCFENIIIIDRDYDFQARNIRLYRDTAYNVKHLPFYNCNHYLAYDLSPYDETLFIDADYLIMSGALSACWGSNQDFMINSNIQELMFSRKGGSVRIDDFGIKLYWATAIYFKKTKEAETIFSLVKHVYENYRYYRQLYLIPRGLFRNDFAFSIAVHMVNGFLDNGLISELPIAALYKSFDGDDIYSVNDINDITMMLEKPDGNGKFILTRFKGLDIHIMNKYAVVRKSDDIIRLYR